MERGTVGRALQRAAVVGAGAMSGGSALAACGAGEGAGPRAVSAGR